MNAIKGTETTEYLAKDGQKDDRDKGHRDYRVWGKRRKIVAAHGLIGGNSYKWRMRCRIVAWHMDIPIDQDFSDIAGKRWAFHLGDAITAINWEYVKYWLKAPDLLELPEVQDWSWIKQGRDALRDVEYAYINLHDLVKDPEVIKKTSIEIGSETEAQGDAPHPDLPGLGVVASYEQH